MFGLIKKIFVGLLICLVNGSNYTKCVLLNNKKCMIQSTLIILHPNEYSEEFHYYSFSVKFDRCDGSFNALNDLSNKLCVLNKTGDLNLSVFNMITGINKSKILTKDISCECKCSFYKRKCNSDQLWHSDKSRWEFKKHHICEKDFVSNPATCNLASIIDKIICDEIIKTEEKILMKKYRLQNTEFLDCTRIFTNYSYIIHSY